MASSAVWLSAPAGAADLSTTIAILNDGTTIIDWPPIGQNPGDDLGPNNNIVLTLDTSVIEVTYKVDQPPTNGDVLLAVTVSPTGGSPLGTARIADGWSQPACPGSTGGVVNASRTTFTCNLGASGSTGFSAGGTFTVDVVAPRSTPNGSTFEVSSTITDGDGSETQTTDEITVSAAPRFDLFKESLGSQTVARPTGVSSTGTTGILQRWVVGLRGEVASGGLGLSELTPSVFTLTDFVSSSPVTPVHLVPSSCSASLGFGGWPAQVSSAPTMPDRQLRQPSTLSCVQSTTPTAGNEFPPVTVTLGGIDWSRAASPPTLDQFGSALGANHLGLVAYFTFTTWVSHDDIDAADGIVNGKGSVVVCNAIETGTRGTISLSGVWSPDSGAVSTFDPVDVGGVSNLLAAREAVANNGVCQPLVSFEPTVSGTYGKNASVPVINGAGVLPTATTRSAVTFFNTGNVPYPLNPPVAFGDKVVLCDKWDNSRFVPSASVGATLSKSFAGTFSVTVEYGTGQWGAATGAPAGDAARWYNQAKADCSDTTITNWTPESAIATYGTSGAVAAFNAVRVVFNDQVPAGNPPNAASVSILPTWAMYPPPTVPFGDEFRNYSAAFLPANNQWFPSNCTNETSNSCPGGLVRGQSAGSNSHWWTTIGGTVDVVKDVIGPHQKDPGSTVKWRVRARGLPWADPFNQPNPFPTGGGPTTNVVLRDVLPPGISYVPNSTAGLPEPTAVIADTRLDALGPGFPVAYVPDPGYTTLEWDIGNLAWSQTYDVNFTFDTVVDPFADPVRYVNTAFGSTPDDPADYLALSLDVRVDDDYIDVRQGTRAIIDKLVSPVQPVPGDTVTFTLRYGNTSAATFNTMDGIDILPFDGDPRGSVIAPGSFTLTGVNVSGHGEVAWLSFVAPATLDAFNGDPVNGLLDPVAAAALPTTSPDLSAQWACTLAQLTAGACGSFTLADVTAIRFVGTTPSPFLQANEGPFPIILTFAVGPGAADGDTYVNSWANLFEGLETLTYRAQAATVVNPGPSPTPALAVAKEVRDGDGRWVEATTIAPGGDAVWRITVTNTGGATLSAFTFTDPAFAGCESAGMAAAPASLAPGQSFSFTCTDTGLKGGYRNRITVEAVGPGGQPVEGADDAHVDVERGGPGPGATPVQPPRTGPLVGTGANLAEQAVQASLLVILGAALVASGRRRERRRAAFTLWVASATADDLFRFARDISLS